MRKLALTLLALAPVSTAALAQDIAAGERTFKACFVCHSIGPGAKNKVGPELNGLDGRPAGSVAGYNYSPANKSSGIVWNERTFKEYIKDPRGRVPGTRMTFPGIKDERDIADLWAYVRQFNADGGRK